eukprot:7303702-Prymnesium_polylepis.1
MHILRAHASYTHPKARRDLPNVPPSFGGAGAQVEKMKAERAADAAALAARATERATTMRELAEQVQAAADGAAADGAPTKLPATPPRHPMTPRCAS